MEVKKAVILAGGFGTRFLPATISVAKEMFPIVDTPILFYHLKECAESGITDVLIVSSKGKKEIKDFINPPKKLINKLIEANKQDYLNEYYKIRNCLNIKIIYQNKQTGSGSALLEAKTWAKKDPFILFNGDDLFNTNTPVAKQLIDVHSKTGKNVCIMQKVSKQNISKYGCAFLGKKHGTYADLLKIVEKPKTEDAPSAYAIVGRYLLTSEIFKKLKNISLKNGEYNSTDAISMLASENKCVATSVDGEYCDCGNKLEYAKTFVKFVLKSQEFGTKFAKFIKQIAKNI